MNRRTALAAAATILTFIATGRSEEFQPVPPVSAINGAALRDGERAALACGAEWLLARTMANERGLIVEPAVKGHSRRAYTVRYSRKTIDEPVYEWDYEEVLVARRGGDSEVDRGEHELVKRRRRIPGSRRQIGVRQVEREVADPQGTIVREIPASRVAEQWQYGLLGQNALGLFALLAAGVPQTHEGVTRLAETLGDHVRKGGCPDYTWDLAWLLAAFSRLDDPAFDEPRIWLTHKLLDAQIAEGPARGLWGPVAVNPELLAAMIRAERVIDAELAKRQAAAAAKPLASQLQEQARQLETARRYFTAHYARISRQGLRFDKIQERWNMAEQHQDLRITVPGLPFSIYRESVADMESTALALYALRAAQRRAPLPETVWRPPASRGKPLIAAERSSAILARTAAALARAQNRDGAWLEENTYQGVEHFKTLGYEPPQRNEWLNLPSSSSPAALAQAIQSLRCLCAIVGPNTLLGRYRTMAERGRSAALAATGKWLSDSASLPAGDSPYLFLAMSAQIERPFEGPLSDRPDIRARSSYRLLLAQNDDGSWSQGARSGYSSGIMAYRAEFARRQHDEAQKQKPLNQRIPFDAEQWNDEFTAEDERLHRFDAAAVDTALAMLYLAENLRHPFVAGYIKEMPNVPFPSSLRQALVHIEKEMKLQPSVAAITPDVSSVFVSGFPALFLDARSPLTAPGLKGMIQSYLANDGLLIVECPDTDSAARMEDTVRGLAGHHIRTSRIALARSLASARPTVIERTAEAVQAGRLFPGQPESGIPALFREDGTLAAVFLPLPLSGWAAIALQDRLETVFFEPAYAGMSGERSAQQIRNAALATLTGSRKDASANPETKKSRPPSAPDRKTEPAEDEVW